MEKHHAKVSLILSLNHLGFVIFVLFTLDLDQILKIQPTRETHNCISEIAINIMK